LNQDKTDLSMGCQDKGRPITSHGTDRAPQKAPFHRSGAARAEANSFSAVEGLRTASISDYFQLSKRK
jgi:hypothetical protein